MKTTQSKIFALLQFGGSILLLGLFIATVTAHALLAKDSPDADDDTKSLAVYFTSPYTAIVMYGVANAASALVVFSSSGGSIGSILYCAFDALFVICAGGAFLGSQVATFNNGGGVAMMVFLMLLLALKVFPMIMLKFKVLEATMIGTNIPFTALMFFGIKAIAIGGVAVLGAALTVLSVYIRVLYHDDNQYSDISLLSLNLPIFLSAVLLISFSSLFFLKDRIAAHSVDFINFVTQLILGYNLNVAILFLYNNNSEWKQNDSEKTFVFLYNSYIAMTVFTLLMMISTIFISVLRPFVSTSEDTSDDEKKPLNKD